jgi:hypothetical protein
MDRAQIRRELSFIQERIADTQELITRYREKIELHRESDRSSVFDVAMLRECESVLRIHLSVKRSPERQLSLHSTKAHAPRSRQDPR